ncbi:hypothetical protein Tco_1255290 [Tanacetum coccineum]
MDDPNITMEEYIRLEEEKAHRRGKVYKWETVAYDGKNYGSNNHKDDEHGYYELMAWIDSKHDNKGIDRMTKSTLCHAWVYGWGNDESD